MNDLSLLRLLQLSNSVLPVGGYTYSEGLETLVDAGEINNPNDLRKWLEQELRCGAIRLEAALMLRAYQNSAYSNLEILGKWNAWASAARETEELRQQSWQMGRALIRLLLDTEPHLETKLSPSLQDLVTAVGNPCNYAIAFGMAATYWQIDTSAVVLSYLHSWTTNVITAGVKLMPLGQTAGQQLLLDLHPHISLASTEIQALEDDDLNSCSWGLALASMAHETQYTRLFRS